MFPIKTLLLQEQMICGKQKMRQSLKKLIQNAIVLQYELPYNMGGIEIPHAHISTSNDRCLKQVGTNDDIAKLIYNGIVEYAYNENEINLTQLDNLQIRALKSKLKYNSVAPQSTQLAYGFHGEVMLHLILDHFYNASKCIARGYMFSALENAETKGYDSYLMVENRDVIFLLFGEAKFYIQGYKTSLKAIFENIEKALSDAYLNRNFIAMDNQYVNIATGSRIPAIIDEWRANPLINTVACARRHNMHLVYPMLIIFDDKANTYDELILEVINHIQSKYGDVNSTLSIPHSIFFIFLPVENSRIIKMQVLQWISQQQPVMQ